MAGIVDAFFGGTSASPQAAAAPASPVTSTEGPLSGIRVIDLSRLLPGPYCTMLLRDLGAEVIKVEDRNGGDYARYYPPLCADGSSAVFHALNRGKKSVMMDLKKKDEREQFLKLLATADVLVESFRPGVLGRMGLAPADLAKRFPRLVICSITGYGQTGPDTLRAGHDVNYLARAGVLGMSASPALLPVQVADLACGAWPAAMQIVTALYARQKSNRGSVIDVSMTDGAYSLLVMPLARHALAEDGKAEPISQGRDWLAGAVPCYGVYKTKNGHLAVGALEPKFWEPFVTAIGAPELCAGALHTGEDGERVRAALARVLEAHTTEHWEALLRAKKLDAEVCVERVALPEDVARGHDAHLRARQLDLTISIPAAAAASVESSKAAPAHGHSSAAAPSSSSSSSSSSSAASSTTLSVPKTHLRMTGVVHAALPAPQIGQHTQAVLAALPAFAASASASASSASAPASKSAVASSSFSVAQAQSYRRSRL